MLGLLRRWWGRGRRRGRAAPAGPAFEAMLDLDVGSLPPGVRPDAAMIAVHARLAAVAGAVRVRVRVREAAAPVVVRVFVPGARVEPAGAAWVELKARLLGLAVEALAREAGPDAPEAGWAAPARSGLATGFAEGQAGGFGEGVGRLQAGLAGLAALAQSVSSGAQAPEPLPAVRGRSKVEDGLAALAALAQGVAAQPAPPMTADRREPEPDPSDVDRLARLLGFVLPAEDRGTAVRALRRFGSYGAVLAAPASELAGVPGLGPHSVAAIRLVHEAAVRVGRAGIGAQPVLSDRGRLMEYLSAAVARERIEQFRVLFLDHDGMLLADEVQARGTVNHTPVYPREVVRRALELGAGALVLVHNHPSGDPTPSGEDIAMTRQIGLAASALSLELRDHIIVGNGRSTSFREAGLLG